MELTYEPPVSRLLWIGRPEETWRSYAGMGISDADVPELFRLLRDRSFEEWHPPASWGMVHAWRALAELRVPELIHDLLGILDEGDGLDIDENLLIDLNEIVSLVGPDALPFLKAYFLDSTKDALNRMTAAGAIGEIARRYPATRVAAIALMQSILKNAKDHFVIVNTAALNVLVDLGSRESIELIRRVMSEKLVDQRARGSVERIEFDLGYRERPPANIAIDDLLSEEDTPEDIDAMRSMAQTLAEQEKAEQTKSTTRQNVDSQRKVVKTSKKRNRKK